MEKNRMKWNEWQNIKQAATAVCNWEIVVIIITAGWFATRNWSSDRRSRSRCCCSQSCCRRMQQLCEKLQRWRNRQRRDVKLMIIIILIMITDNVEVSLVKLREGKGAVIWKLRYSYTEKTTHWTSGAEENELN